MSEQWTPGAFPTAPLDAKFRQDLQRALEQTHRQQAARRKLGARSKPKAAAPLRQGLRLAVIVLALLLLIRLLRSSGNARTA